MSINFKKFRLKPENKILEFLKDKKNIGIVVCNSCFEELTQENFSHQCREIINTLVTNEKKLLFCLELNFLCNSYINKEKIISASDKHPKLEALCVISCGIGVQFVSDIVEKETISLADSIQPRYNSTAGVNHHGINLNNLTFCATCGKCHLTYTEGVCPIVYCSKSLLNGPCGGAKNGKCEVDKNIDCGWEIIYKKIKAKNSKFNSEVKVRNYYNLSYSQQKQNLDSNLHLRINSFFGGVYPIENKEITENIPIKEFTATQFLALFFTQHTGKPSVPIVKEGDYVRVGQKIAERDGFISSNLHSPISGKVLEFKEILHPKIQRKLPAVIIENDFQNKMSDEIKPHPDWRKLPKQQVLEIISESGIVGLGGAMFPTHVKLNPPKPIDIVVINGCECEPYLNVDNRIMIEYTKEVFEGIEIIRYLLEPKKIVVVIEDNKPQAMQKLIETKPSDIEIIVVNTKYPHGAEKILIKKLFNVSVPYDKIPLDFGFLVQNVSTVFALYNTVVNGFPLIERVITVSGEEETKKEYGNYKVKIGTLLEDIIRSCYNENFNSIEFKIKYAGYMTGVEIEDFSTSIIKGCNGILALRRYIQEDYNNKCIKCGRCVDVCPLELEPLEFVRCYHNNELSKASKYNIKSCVECGCCQYVCASKIPILEIIKKEKKEIIN
ncbi:MAG: electron transport complex subunit RsxC [Endomicrobia bacterium]|nr:electron transport complex subunit RsxC [Endomicrobiia bacterium]